MPSKHPFRVTRDVPGGLNPGSFGRKAGMGGQSAAGWADRMGSSGRGAKEVLVKISGGGRDADGVQAHFEYIDRHGKLDIETDYGDVLHGKTAATELINDWALDYGAVPGAPHSRSKVGTDGKRREPRQAFNIVLSMPAGTPPQKVLQAVKKFAREEFAHRHRYALALHSEEKGKHGMHPHVHLVVKAEHEYDGSRLNPQRKWKRPPAQKAPAVDEEIKRMVDSVEPQTLRGLRDRAVLLLVLGFAGAFRRSELVGLDVDHLTQRDEGLSILIQSSKTDQEGIGQVVAIPRVPDSPYCPVRAVLDWLVVAGISAGPIFRRVNRGDTVGESRLTAQSVALIIKALAAKVELDPARYAGHSLRSGFLTSAAHNRASIFKMADQSRHKSLDVLREYVRSEERFDDHAADGLLQPKSRPRPG